MELTAPPAPAQARYDARHPVVQRLTEEATDLLAALIAIPRFSREEKVGADYVQRWLAERGLTPKRHGNNVWCLAPGFKPGRPTVLFNSHLDTVRPVAGWQRDPHTPSLEDGKLYGLGSNDAGGCAVALTLAFWELAGHALPINMVLALTAEEEISGRNGIEALWPLLPPIDLAVVGEPTGNDLAIAERGLLVLDCIAHGKAGHAARQEGINAIYEALPAIEWFSNYSFERDSPWLGPVTMQVTQIMAGTQHNAVPATCQFVVDIRLNERYTHQEIIDLVRAHVTCEVSARSTRLRPTGIAEDHPAVRAAVKLGRSLYGSPTLSDRALIPSASIKMGPGQSARSHTADEYIFVEEIADGIANYLNWSDLVAPLLTQV